MQAEGEHVLDLTMQAIQASLDGLAARQRVIAENLANSETPGYQAQTVSFEDSLASAVAGGDATMAQISTGTSSAPVGANGNNVDMNKETLSLVDTGMRYQLATESMNNEFKVIGDSMRQDL